MGGGNKKSQTCIFIYYFYLYRIGAGLGLSFIVGRELYMQGFKKDPKMRGPGFMVCVDVAFFFSTSIEKFFCFYFSF